MSVTEERRMERMSCILLTGATGYVGGRLLPALEGAGYVVRCLARRPEFLRQRVGPRTEVVQGVSESALYVSDGSSPAIALPSYYMLQLLTNCGPDSRYVGLLSEGQISCDPGVPQRDTYWLEHEPQSHERYERQF